MKKCRKKKGGRRQKKGKKLRARAINRTCYRILLGLDIINVHSLSHSSHLQLPRSLKRRIADEQLIAYLDALLVLTTTK